MKAEICRQTKQAADGRSKLQVYSLKFVYAFDNTLDTHRSLTVGDIRLAYIVEAGKLGLTESETEIVEIDSISE